MRTKPSLPLPLLFPLRTLSAIGLALALSVSSGCKFGTGDSAGALKKAQAAIAANDIATAQIELKNVIQTAPKNAEARFLLGQIAYDEGRMAEAEPEFRKALELGYDPEQLARPFLESVLKLSGFAKMKEEAAKLKVAQPTSKAAILSLYGQAYFNENKPDEAAQAFSSALQADPDHVAAKAGQIRLMAGRGDLAGAFSAAQSLVLKAPQDNRSHLALADMMIATNQTEAFEKTVRQAIALKPRDPVAHALLVRSYLQNNNQTGAQTQLSALEKIAPNQPTTLYLKAALLYLRKENAQARDIMQVVTKAMPEFTAGNLLAGQIAYDLTELTLAENFAKKVVANSPGDNRGYELLAAIYLKMGAPERALATVKPLLDAGRKEPGLLEIAAQAATNTNDHQKAQTLLGMANAQGGGSEQARIALATSKAMAGDVNHAITELESMAKSNSSGPDKAALPLIELLMKEKQYDKAALSANELIKKFPKNPVPLHTLGEIYLAKGDTAAASQTFQKAVALVPDFLPSINALANIDLKLGNKEAARAHLDKAVQKDPKNAHALLGLARVLAAGAGSTAQALEAHRAAKAAAPGLLEPGLALGQFLMQHQQYPESIAVLEEMLQTRPSEQSILDALALSLARSGNRGKAMEVLDRMLKANPESAVINYRIGELRTTLNDYPGALSAFQRSAELQPKAIEGRAAVASMYLKMGRKTEAKSLITQLTSEAPRSALVATLAGDLASADKQQVEAVNAYQRALSLYKSEFIAQKLHSAMIDAGQDAQADQFLRDWWVANPNDIGLMLQAGEQKMNKAQWKEAVAIFGAVLKTRPDIAPALNNMAWSLHQLNDKNAKPIAQKALSLEPKSHVIMDTLGVISVDQGDSAKGLELLRAAVTAAPNVGEYRVHLAKALLKIGDKAGAVSEVERLLREQPSDPAAPQARELRKQLGS